MYQSNDSYEAYPPEINIQIEKSYRDKKRSAHWEENDGRYEVDFVRMAEEKVGSTGNAVKVKRETMGTIMLCVLNSACCIIIIHFQQ